MSTLHAPFRLAFRRTRSAGERYLRANRFADAEAAFADEAAAGSKDPRPLLVLGHMALMRNDLTPAKQLLSAALERDPKCRQASELLAEAYARGDEFGTAATHQLAAGNRPVATKLASFSGRPPYAIEGPDHVRVPFVRIDPLPIVMASINGGAEAPFFIDTGGGEVILDTDFAAAAGIAQFGSESTFFGGGRTAKIGHGAVDSLRVGGMTVRNLPINTLGLAAVGPLLGVPGLAGCIGTCLLYRFLATIDYPGEALVLRQKPGPAGGRDESRTGESAERPELVIEVPILMADDHFILAAGRLNDGAPTTFFVDSGLAGGAFACPESTLKEAGIRRGSTRTVKGSGGGGAMRAWPFDVASLSLGGARREGLQGVAGAFPPQLEWAFGFRIGGLISHGFLREYAVTFDFERMTMNLEPA